MKVQRSTLDELKRNVAVMGASKAARLLNEREGGVVSARSAGQLVWNLRQAYNAKYTTSVAPSVPMKWRPSVDPYLSLLTRCNKTAANKDIAFIRRVQLAPKLEILLATETQLDLMEKFTTNPLHYSILSADATFNCGEFDVTCSTFKHLQVVKKDNDRVNPVLLGPILIHQRKLSDSYSFFSLP
jgi:hypothetical protein